MDPAPVKGEIAPELDRLSLEDLERLARERNGQRPLPLREWVALAETWRILQALRESRGNRSAAAIALGIGRRTLYSKMDRLGIEGAWRVWRSRGDAEGGEAGPG